MKDADFIVIGSGPAGVSVALALCEAGRSVLMLDGADGDAPLAGDHTETPGSAPAGLSPKLGTPEARRIMADFAAANGVSGENFLPAGSLARGGLSRIWGGFAAEFDSADMAGWPIGSAALAPSYVRIAARIGISGMTSDRIGGELGANGPLQPPLPLGAATAMLLHRYQATEEKGNWKLGHARNAVISQALRERPACDLRGACLWGCPIGAIYDARQDLRRLARSDGFRLADGACVTALERQADGWQVRCRDRRAFTAARLVLAAGTLGSSRLVAPLLPALDQWMLASNPTVATALLLPAALMAKRVVSHSLAQLAYVLRFGAQAGDYVCGAVYETSNLPAWSLAATLPLGRRAAETLIGALSPALLVAATSFPGSLSRNSLRFDRAVGKLIVTGGFEAGLDGLQADVSRRMRRNWRRLGVWTLPGARRAMPGTDAHFAGTLPMGGRGANGTSVLGELASQHGLHVVDGSILPSLPAKHATLTIMANADRIGTALARL